MSIGKIMLENLTIHTNHYKKKTCALQFKQLLLNSQWKSTIRSNHLQEIELGISRNFKLL